MRGVAACLALVACAAAAQNDALAQLSITVEPSPVTLSDVALMSVLLRDTSTGDVPFAPIVASDGFAVEALAPATGRRVGRGVQWRFVLAPIRPGDQSVEVTLRTSRGAIQRRVDVRVVELRSLDDTDLPSARTDPDASSSFRDLAGHRFVRAEVDGTAPYVHQQVTYRFAYFFENWSPSSEAPQYALPTFGGFVDHQLENIMAEPVVQSVDGRAYHVQHVRVALFPLVAGRQTIAEAELFLRSSDGGRVNRLHTSEIGLHVASLPEPVPEGFSGGVGEFEVRVEFPADDLVLRTAAHLRVIVAGRGLLRTLSEGPIIETDLQTYEPSVIDVVDVVDGLVGGTRTFEYVLAPIESGTVEIEVLPYVTFSPANRTYRRSEPVRRVVHVLDQVVGSDRERTAASQGAQRRGRPWTGIVVIGILAGSALIALGIARRHGGRTGREMSGQTDDVSSVPPARSGRPRETATRLDDLRPGDARDLCQRLRSVVLDVAASRVGTPTGASTTVLRLRKMDAQAAVELHGVLEACDQGAFGPNTLDAPAQQALLDRARAAVVAFESSHHNN